MSESIKYQTNDSQGGSASETSSLSDDSSAGDEPAKALQQSKTSRQNGAQKKRTLPLTRTKSFIEQQYELKSVKTADLKKKRTKTSDGNELDAFSKKIEKELEVFSQSSKDSNEKDQRQLRQSVQKRRASVKFSRVEANGLDQFKDNKNAKQAEKDGEDPQTNDLKYSSGASDQEGQFFVKYKMLPEADKKERMLWLWERAFKKAKGASIIIRKHIYQNNKIYVDGFANRRNVNFIQLQQDLENEELGLEESMSTQNPLTHVHNKVVPWLIYPDQPQKRLWDILIVFLLVYTAMYVPFKVCFIDDSSDFQFAFDLFVDVCFMGDIVINFFSVIEDETGSLITNRTKIARRYIKGWFFIDLFTSLPFQVLEKIDFGADYADYNAVSTENHKVLRLARIPRLYRLLRIFRLFKLLRIFNQARKVRSISKMTKLNNSIKQMFTIISMILFVNHVFACFWFF